tara:strand:- start:4409 stop:5125 length:717 start_codon:yes stop_codon:yes gene_type:complete
VIFAKKEKASGAIAVSHAERTLRRQILEGFYLPGDKVSDSTISNELGISRTSIRESFQRLAQDGLITIIPNRGAFVTEHSQKEIFELFELRDALEVFAVAQATKRAPQRMTLALKEMLTITKASMVEHGGRYPVELDFHATVCEMAGNETLQREIKKVHQKLKLVRIHSGYNPARAREAYIEHSEILEAMIKRDVKAAENAMRSHLNNSKISTQTANYAPEQKLNNSDYQAKQSLLGR